MRTIFSLRLCIYIERKGVTPLLDVFVKEEDYARKGGRGFGAMGVRS
jgi:hypothetical protein